MENKPISGAKETTYAEAEIHVLQAMRKGVGELVWPNYTRAVRLVALVRCCEFDLEIRRRQRMPLPLLAGGQFEYEFDEAAVPLLMQKLRAPELAVRAGLAWLSRTESNANDYSFFEDEILAAAGFRERPAQCHALANG